MKGLFIWGASGHGKVVLDVVHAVQKWHRIAFIDDAWTGEEFSFMGFPVIGSRAQLPVLRQRGYYGEFLIGIGQNAARARCFSEAVEHGFVPAIAIHPTAILSRYTTVGSGTVIMPRAVVNAGTAIGNNCIINSGAIVEHDCVIGEHAHLSPGAVLGGGVRIGAYAHVGLNASILPLAQIGEGAVIGAGAVVLHSVGSGQTVVGVPARPVGPCVERALA